MSGGDQCSSDGESPGDHGHAACNVSLCVVMHTYIQIHTCMVCRVEAVAGCDVAIVRYRF